MTRKKTDVQRKIASMFLTGYLWLVIALTIFAGYLFYQYRESLQKNGQEILNLYKEEVSDLLLLSSDHLQAMLYNNSYSNILRHPSSELHSYQAAYDLKSVFENQLSLQPSIAGFQFLYNNGKDWYYAFRDNGVISDKALFFQDAQKHLQNGKIAGQWTLLKGKKRDYLSLTYGDKDLCISILIDCSAISIHTGKSDLQKENISLSFSDSQTVNTLENNSSFSNRMSVFSTPLETTDLFLVLQIPFYYSNVWQILFFCAGVILVLTFLCIFLGYHSIRKTFVVPLHQISHTIQQINQGELQQRVPEELPIEEYQEIGKSFNAMMDQIETLKIQAYEERIKEEKTKLQYLQSQIRPHFFLNCLKVLYAQLQQQQYQRMGNMILDVSNYFRYIFRNTMNEVSLRDEVNFTQSYLFLIRNNTQSEIECLFCIPDTLMDLPTIPLALQTFVENSFKYANAEQGLLLKITAHLLSDEQTQFLILTISDNGKGYSAEWMNNINYSDQLSADGSHIGILNLKKRLKITYGEESEIVVRNQNGATTELIYPISRGDTNERNCD